MKINKGIQCAVCALPHIQLRSLHSAVPFLHLTVRFYIPTRTTFPIKMAALRNSPSSLSQHDLLVCYVCVRELKNAMSVFNYVTFHEDFFFLSRNVSVLLTLPDVRMCACIWECIHACLKMHTQLCSHMPSSLYFLCVCMCGYAFSGVYTETKHSWHKQMFALSPPEAHLSRLMQIYPKF